MSPIITVALTTRGDDGVLWFPIPEERFSNEGTFTRPGCWVGIKYLVFSRWQQQGLTFSSSLLHQPIIGDPSERRAATSCSRVHGYSNLTFIKPTRVYRDYTLNSFTVQFYQFFLFWLLWTASKWFTPEPWHLEVLRMLGGRVPSPPWRFSLCVSLNRSSKFSAPHPAKVPSCLNAASALQSVPWGLHQSSFYSTPSQPV